MANYQKILVAIDFSDEFESVMQKAIELQRQNDAGMSLIHVVEYTGALYTGEIPLPEVLDLDQRLEKRAKERLQHLVDSQPLQNIRCLVETGTPKHEITRVAKERDMDLIILGSHGRHGLQLLLGSTANGVLHLASCDVLAVRVNSS